MHKNPERVDMLNYRCLAGKTGTWLERDDGAVASSQYLTATNEDVVDLRIGMYAPGSAV